MSAVRRLAAGWLMSFSNSVLRVSVWSMMLAGRIDSDETERLAP